MRLRRRQNKNQICRRLLQRLEKSIKGARCQHMHLVDNIHLIAPLRRRILHFVNNLTDVVHTVIGRRVNFHDIHRRMRLYRLTHGTCPARTLRAWILAIHRFGKYFGNRRLTGASRPAEQIGMPDTICFYLVAERSHNMLLPFYIRKIFRTVFSIQSLIRHTSSPVYTPKLIPRLFAS